MKLLVRRNGQNYGPYPPQLAQQYLDSGRLLPQDLARDVSRLGDRWETLDKLLKAAGCQSAPNDPNSISKTLKDLKSFDSALIFPWKEIKSLRWLQHKQLMLLALIGLLPATLTALTGGSSLGYWAIGFYFSALWAVFFHGIFKTNEVQVSFCFLCFFFTGIISIAVLLIVQQIPPWRYLYAMAKSDNILTRALGMFFGVGINEEICKAAIIFWLVRRPGTMLMPKTIVFYAMISGLSFGIYEGVAYQLTVNRLQEIDTAYFLNIARLTSLPFLHAIWAGIAGYFISFSALVPKKKYGLWLLAIFVPACLHAGYNTFGWSLLGLGLGFLGVILLMTYLSNSQKMMENLTP